MNAQPAPITARRFPVIVNVDSGRGHDESSMARLRDLFASHGLAADIVPVRTGAEVLERAQQAVREKASMVVAAGGDGTVSAVASCLKGSRVALAVLPMGTLNHFAKDLGVPVDLEVAARIIADGHRVAIDLGEVNGRTFINNASLGIYPDIVRDRERRQRRLGYGKYWAMLWATLSVLRRSPFLRLQLEIDGRIEHWRSPFVFVGNNDYVMEGFNIGVRSSIRDGRLSIYMTRRHTRLGLLVLALHALVGRLRQAADFAMTSATVLRIDSRRRRLLVAVDGEVAAMETPLEFRVLRGALTVMAPAPAP